LPQNTHHRMKNLLLTISLLLLCYILTAQPATDPAFNSGLASALQTALQQQGATLGIRNLSACVYIPGQGTWVGTYNASGVLALPTDARFGIASNSKAFVAGICLRLKSEGLLDLDAPISTYLPNLTQITPHVSSNITTRQLLNHQSGLFDFYNQANNTTLDNFDLDPDRIWLPSEVLATIGAPNHAPGTSFYYSNTNFLVAAMVCEAITGQSFSQLLQEKIAQPLGLSRTNYPAGGDPIYNSAYAPLYSSSGASVAIDTANANSFWSTIQAAGGIASTPWDMVKWYRTGLFEVVQSPTMPGILFDYATQRELFEVEPWSSYSLGLRARNGENGGSFLYHAGAWGYRSYMIHDKETGITVCVLGNQFGKSVTNAADRLYTVARNQLPQKTKEVEILNVMAPIGQNCSSAPLKLQIKNTGTQALDSAILQVNLALTCCASSQTIYFSPALQPGQIVVWAATDAYNETTIDATQLNVVLSASADIYPFRATESSFFDQRIDWSQSAMVLPYTQDFSQLERGKLPEGWLSYQPDNVQDWRTSTLAGNGGALCKNNLNDGAEGQAYYVELPILPPNTGAIQLSFDYAYALYPDYEKDSLFVEFSTDCGENWITLWEKSGPDLQTASSTSNSFRPTSSSQWETAAIVVPNHNTVEGNILRLKAISYFGNNLWLDNFSVDMATGTKPVSLESAAYFSPNPMGQQAVLRTSIQLQSATLVLTDVLGKKWLEIPDCNGSEVSITRGNLSSGTYFYTIWEKGQLVMQGKLLVTD
jgi:D-alanyl-D-alanine carboxypeptidase